VTTLKEMIARARAICGDPKPIDESALVALWRREQDGMARSAILSMGVHGEELAASMAEQAIAAGCTPSLVLDALEECDRRYGSPYDGQAPKKTQTEPPTPWSYDDDPYEDRGRGNG
jgi:hypothetical protein